MQDLDVRRAEGAEDGGNRGDGALLYKDASLNRLSERANVAQFVSFAPDLAQRHARVRGFEPNRAFGSVESAAAAMLAAAPDGSVNVRSFLPEKSKGCPFVYGLKRAEDCVAHVRRLASEGYYTIINETVDIRDGGVSGVIFGDVIQFAPDDTPRCVDSNEPPPVASLPRAPGLAMLETVYNFAPALDFSPRRRVEFSVHPLRRGFRHGHTIVWEVEEYAEGARAPDIRWPNRFSRFLGDKAFGLLVADSLGLPVPLTTVFARRVAPFSFGTPTRSGEFWIRTCPVVQEPGLFTTRRGWLDPFKLMRDEDPRGDRIASVLAQEGVDARYSGSLVVSHDGELTVEGVGGYGDEFMVGRAGREALPAEVREAVERLYARASSRLGAVRFEWVYDGREVWVVQLHVGATSSHGDVIYEGHAEHFRRFAVADGIDALRALIAELEGTGTGVLLVGNVGVTSHFGDVLRRARIPSRVIPPES